MLRGTPTCRVSTISTVLAGTALFNTNLFGLCDPFGVLFLSGVVFRALSLPASIYGDCCLARAACALPELQEAHIQYKTIIDHPRAILWEKKVAAQKLKNDRERIFRSHRTDNVRLVLPHALALVGSWYSLCIPAQQVAEFLGAGAVASHLTLNAMGATVDMTIALAATITLINTRDHLRRRMGFSDGLDSWIRQGKRNMMFAWGAIVAGSLLAPCVAGPSVLLYVLPPQIAPVWLGIAVMSGCKSILVNHTAPMRALFGIQEYPPTHGKHGAFSTAEAHEYRLAFTGVDVEERREMWQTQKKVLDYECNVRLHRMLKSVGLFDRIEEAEHEAEKLQRKLDVARERKRQREHQQQCGNGENAPFDCVRLSEADVVGPSAESVATRHFDEMQARENERRRQRRGAGEP